MGRRNPPARWVLPETINPEGRKCITVPVPDERFHIAAFWGALRNLASGAQWADDPDHKAREVAMLWRDIIDEMEWGCDMSNFDVRQNEDQPCILDKTEDNGATWTAWANLQKCPPNIRVNKGIVEWFNPVTDEWEEVDGGDERETGTAPPPWPGNPDGACLAAENIAAIYATALTQARAGLVAGEVAVAISATITGIMSLFIPAAIVSTFALAITGIAIDVGIAGLDDMLDEESLDNFKCTVYCNISSDGSVTADQFGQVRASMGAWASSAELLIIQFWLDGFGPVGLTRQGRANGITTGDCDTCDCGWTHVFLNGGGNAGGVHLVPVDQGAFGNGGVYNLADDRFDSPENAGVAYHVVALLLDTSAVTDFTITRIKMWATGSFVNNGGSNDEWKIQVNGSNVAFVSLPQTTPSPHTEMLDSGVISSFEPNSINFYVDASKTEGITQGFLYSSRIEISGEGTNPFL